MQHSSQRPALVSGRVSIQSLPHYQQSVPITPKAFEEVRRPCHHCCDQWTAANTPGSSSSTAVATVSPPLPLTKKSRIDHGSYRASIQSLNPLPHFTGQSQGQLVDKTYLPSLGTIMTTNNEAEIVVVATTRAQRPVTSTSPQQVVTLSRANRACCYSRSTHCPAFPHFSIYITLIIVGGTKQRCGASSVEAQKLGRGNQTHRVIQVRGKATRGR